jgi:hypothetical protein
LRRLQARNCYRLLAWIDLLLDMVAADRNGNGSGPAGHFLRVRDGSVVRANQLVCRAARSDPDRITPTLISILRSELNDGPSRRAVTTRGRA